MITKQIETPRLILCCLEADDVSERYRAWMSDPAVTQYLETRFEEPTIDSLAAYVRRMRDSKDSYFFGMFDRTSREHYGNIKVGPISVIHATASIGLIIGEKKAWGHGFGSEAISSLSEWAFDHLTLAKLTAGSYGLNRGSIRAFENSGFVIEGIERSQVQLADGSRDDVIILGKTRADHRSGSESKADNRK